MCTCTGDIPVADHFFSGRYLRHLQPGWLQGWKIPSAVGLALWMAMPCPQRQAFLLRGVWERRSGIGKC